MKPKPVVLALDAGSPVVAAAVATAHGIVASARRARGEERADLLALVERVLAEARLAPAELGGLVALRGPGGFTGLRVACATALGLAAATGAPATAVPTLEALALATPPGTGELLAVVDALRGDWYLQRFARGLGLAAEALDEPSIARAEASRLRGVALVVGFEAERFVRAGGVEVPALPDPDLAAAAAQAAAAGRWPFDPATLSRPLYLRPPATTPGR